MTELTWRAVLLGLAMTLILGAANRVPRTARGGDDRCDLSRGGDQHGGPRRLGKGSILEENLARTAGSIGESVAAGAIFTLPAFASPGSGRRSG